MIARLFPDLNRKLPTVDCLRKTPALRLLLVDRTVARESLTGGKTGEMTEFFGCETDGKTQNSDGCVYILKVPLESHTFSDNQ